jgi:hypothetical protein
MGTTTATPTRTIRCGLMRPDPLTSFGSLYSAYKNKGGADDANKLKARLIEILRKIK